MENFHSIEDIIEDVRQGKLVIMSDDESRENEGDLIFAGDRVSPEHVNFMIRYGRGLICVPMAAERIDALGLEAMAQDSEDPYATAFTLSVDAKKGITTGISAYDRSHTIQILSDPEAVRADLAVPGHIFPLKAMEGGVLRRAGHTEAAVDLAKLAGRQPVGVICEIINDDGKMARVPDLLEFSKKHDIKMGTIRDLIEYRRRRETLVEKISETVLSESSGIWRLMTYRSIMDGSEHIALVKGTEFDYAVPVRVSIKCFADEMLKLMKKDDDNVLFRTMSLMESEKSGVVLFVNQTNRGMGLAEKLHETEINKDALHAVSSENDDLPKTELRDYGIGAQILKDMGLDRLSIITNHPKKIVGLDGHGLHVDSRVPMPEYSEISEGRSQAIREVFKIS